MDSDKKRILNTEKYIRQSDIFNITTAIHDEYAIDEINSEFFDVIVYFTSENSDPEMILDEISSENSLFILVTENEFSYQVPETKKCKIVELTAGKLNDIDFSDFIEHSVSLYKIERALLLNSKKNKLFFENAPVSNVILDNSGAIIASNKNWKKISGYTDQDINGNLFSGLLSDNDRETFNKFLNNVTKEKKENKIELKIKRKNKQEISSIIYAAPLPYQKEKSGQILFSIIDITLKNASHQGLINKMRIFDALGSSINYLTKTNSIHQDLNNILRIIGVSLDSCRVSLFKTDSGGFIKKYEWTSKNYDFLPDSEILIKEIAENCDEEPISDKLTSEPFSIYIDDKTDNPNNEILKRNEISSFISIPLNINNEFRGFLKVDICNERKEWNQEEIDALTVSSDIIGLILGLKHFELKSRRILDGFVDAVAIIEDDGNIKYANEKAREIFSIYNNYPEKENIKDIFPETISKKLTANIKETLKSGKTISNEFHILKNNSDLWMNIIIQKNQHSKIKQNIILYGRDITEKKIFENRLLLTQLSVETFPDFVYYADEPGNIVYSNKAACLFGGYSKDEILEKDIYDLDGSFTTDTWKKHWNRLKKEKNIILNSKHKKSTGESYPVEIAYSFVKMGTSEFLCMYARNRSDEENKKP
ncbi:PAS domain S-box protein [Methanoplanus sp. FWC-SCC4]|uniref:PAS domain S-box protein n=1 Tax=Methanochimaera problematica TaxID=2609417 RepID=A0AA97FA81_9EURY|nr:PAS domain S-box protein [Methanoplanus sp. FWC-SCC4]WOF15427.1 PAS domain S-box protein [Methanoplanus sp. FWC-SCC4]